LGGDGADAESKEGKDELHFDWLMLVFGVGLGYLM